MAKRFTDTEKWKKPFIKELKGDFKLLWFYICDDCDHAGVWQVDMEVANMRIGGNLKLADAVKVFGEKIKVFDNGHKWFIPSFIEFQYPSGLNENNKAHAGIIKILKKYNLLKEEIKPLPSPLQGAKDTYMDKDKEMDKVIKPIENSLSDMEINQTIEFVKITSQKLLYIPEVQKYFSAFQIQYKDKFYPDVGEVRSHFRNWLKDQFKFKNNGTTTSTSSTNRKQQAASNFLEGLKTDFQTYAGGNQDFGT